MVVLTRVATILKNIIGAVSVSIPESVENNVQSDCSRFAYD